MILVEDLTLTCGGVRLLDGVSFAARGRLGVLGASGSGKSLLLRALVGLLPRGVTASVARLEVGGVDVARLFGYARRGGENSRETALRGGDFGDLNLPQNGANFANFGDKTSANSLAISSNSNLAQSHAKNSWQFPAQIAAQPPLTPAQFRRAVAYIAPDAKASFPPLLDVGRFFLLCARAAGQGENLGVGADGDVAGGGDVAGDAAGGDGGDAAGFKARAQALLARLGVADFARLWHAYPHEISSGEAARAALALALALGARAVLCDEVTANLDAANAALLQGVLEGLAGEVGVVVVTHDLAFAARFCDEFLVLDDGRVAEFLGGGDGGDVAGGDVAGAGFDAAKTPLGAEFARILREENGGAGGANSNLRRNPRENPRENSGDNSADNPCDNSGDNPRENSCENPCDNPRDNSGDNPRENLRQN